jgi:hypothetical protein
MAGEKRSALQARAQASEKARALLRYKQHRHNASGSNIAGRRAVGSGNRSGTKIKKRFPAASLSLEQPLAAEKKGYKLPGK